MSLNEWFEKGITSDTYVKSLDKHKEGFSHIYNNVELASFEKDDTFFQLLEAKNLRVIALAEPWCGHCMLNVPILFRLTEKVNMPVRVLPRDEHLELMDQYLTNGKSRTIPIFIFIDTDGNEVAKWGPIAEKTKQFVDKLKVNLPPKEADDYEEKFTQLIELTAKSFSENTDFWQASYEGMKEALNNNAK